MNCIISKITIFGWPKFALLDEKYHAFLEVLYTLVHVCYQLCICVKYLVLMDSFSLFMYHLSCDFRKIVASLSISIPTSANLCALKISSRTLGLDFLMNEIFSRCMSSKNAPFTS